MLFVLLGVLFAVAIAEFAFLYLKNAQDRQAISYTTQIQVSSQQLAKYASEAAGGNESAFKELESTSKNIDVYVDGDPVRREGIEFKWPFLTEKRDYLYFDAQTRTSSPIHYVGTRTFRGLEVYYYEQTIPWTRVPMPKTMPVEGITPEVIASTGLTRWYTTKRMFWVEPVTGAPVNGEEIHKEELRGAKALMGTDTLTVFAGHVKMREDYIEHTVDLVKSQRLPVLLMTSYLPWGFLGLGLLLLALSLYVEARGRRSGAPQSAKPPASEPVNA